MALQPNASEWRSDRSRYDRNGEFQAIALANQGVALRANQIVNDNICRCRVSRRQTGSNSVTSGLLVTPSKSRYSFFVVSVPVFQQLSLPTILLEAKQGWVVACIPGLQTGENSIEAPGSNFVGSLNTARYS